MRIQSGFTTFTVTLILLLILLAVTLLVGKLLVADRRITLNETLYRQVMALAEQGLAPLCCPLGQGTRFLHQVLGGLIP